MGREGDAEKDGSRKHYVFVGEGSQEEAKDKSIKRILYQQERMATIAWE